MLYTLTNESQELVISWIPVLGLGHWARTGCPGPVFLALNALPPTLWVCWDNGAAAQTGTWRATSDPHHAALIMLKVLNAPFQGRICWVSPVALSSWGEFKAISHGTQPLPLSSTILLPWIPVQYVCIWGRNHTGGMEGRYDRKL